VQRPGTVPVRVESDGDPLEVSVILPDPLATRVTDYHPPGIYSSALYGGFSFGYSPPVVETRAPLYQRVCTTPCTLYLRPGIQALHLGGAGRRDSDELVEVGAQRTRVRFRSASSLHYAFGQGFMWAGASLSVVGVLFMTAGNRCGSPSACDMTTPMAFLISGGLALAVGVPLVIANQTGPVEIPPARRPRRDVGLALGAALLPGGAMGAVGTTF
jgi:hypothetical protein